MAAERDALKAIIRRHRGGFPRWAPRRAGTGGRTSRLFNGASRKQWLFRLVESTKKCQPGAAGIERKTMSATRSRRTRSTARRVARARKSARPARPAKPAKPAGRFVAAPPVQVQYRLCKPGWAVAVEKTPNAQGTRFVCPFCPLSHRVPGPVRGFRKLRRAQWIKLRRVEE